MRAPLRRALVCAAIVFAPLAALQAAGCTVATVSRDDVIELQRLCQKGNDVAVCEDLGGVADGFTPIAVQACVPDSVKERRTDLVAHFRVSSGKWEGATIGSLGDELEVALGSDRCVRATFRPDVKPGPVRVDASWLGYTQTMTFELDGAPLGRVDVLTQDLRFAADGTLQVKLQAVPQTAGASVSTGTTIRCTVDSKSKVPATVQVLPIIDTRQVDGTGAATFTFVAGTTLESVSVDVEAIPPALGTTAPTSAKLSLTLLGPPAVATTTP